MKLQLIQGSFSTKDALDLVTQMIKIKIRYHENKITNSSSEEDIKYRESKIKNLQKELAELKLKILSLNQDITLNGIINIE